MMSVLKQLNLAWTDKLPIHLQTEAAECGLACLSMISHYHGYRTTLPCLRQRFPISSKGSSLTHLIAIAEQLSLATRAVRLDLEDLAHLRLPAILHWEFNHFVVLKAAKKNKVTIYDPAFGIRVLPLTQVSKSFTGIALELWPSAQFKTQKAQASVSLRQLMGKITGLYRSLAQIFILAIALEVLQVIHPFFLQWVIDHVLVSADKNLLTVLAYGFGLLVLIQSLITAVRSWAMVYMETTFGLQWQANIFSHLLRLPVAYFEKRILGDVISRFNATEDIRHTLSDSLLEGILDGMMVLITLLMMFLYSPQLTGWVLIVVSLYILTRWISYRPLRTATEEKLIHSAKQHSHFIETLRGIKTIKLFERNNMRCSSWLTLFVNQLNASLRIRKVGITYGFSKNILFGLGNIGLIWLGATLVIEKHFTVGALIAFNAYRDQFETRVSTLITRLIELKMLRLQGERLADILLATPEASSIYSTNEKSYLSPSIEVIDLYFRYSDTEPYLLNGVTFKIEAGESVAIVGPSGCGKTTLLQLILGILSPTAGEIRIGGVDIKQLELSRLRQHVSSVLQDDVLFSGSISANISFFDQPADLEKITRCAQIAAIADDIEKMPMGYNTLIGDMGIALSGGQKQRLLLARSLYKQAPILLLDEATSHLDIALEQQVNDAVQQLSMTRLIVAHRPETIASADRIIKLIDGRTA